MRTVELPKKIEIKTDKDPKWGQIIIEPCFPGYGITIGNSLRRVLLSSLPGAAVLGVKIEGVEHEFMAKEHLKEDILEFVLNLKKLRLKLFGEENVVLELNVHGKNEITAKDIKPNSQVEIANPELKLGTITDMAGSLNAEITVGRGMGFEMVENREEKSSQVGYIEMDSVFSPVVSVGVKVDNVRVGKMTNWDKLIIDIKTDGTITPKEAFEEATKILISQFNALTVDKKKKEAKEEEKDEKEEKKEEEKPKEEESADEPKKKRGRPKKED